MLQLPREVVCRVVHYVVEDFLDADQAEEDKGLLYWRGDLPMDSAPGCVARCSRSFAAMVMRSLLRSIHLGHRTLSLLPLSKVRLLIGRHGASATYHFSIDLSAWRNAKSALKCCGVLHSLINLRSVRITGGLASGNATIAGNAAIFLFKLLQHVTASAQSFELGTVFKQEMELCLALPVVRQGGSSAL
jgi:hypothetical protein